MSVVTAPPATTPGSRLLFPALTRPTAPITITDAATTSPPSTPAMPRRRRTRTQDRAARIDHERQLDAPDTTTDVERRAREAIPPF